MERIKEAFTGKSREERAVEHEEGRHHPGMGTTVGGGGSAVGDTRAAATGTEYTGGVAGGPAYGSTATGYTAEVPVVQQTTTTTAAMPVDAETTRREGREEVCGAEYFTKVEDRPVVKERVELIQEHRPVEKEFVVETRATGVEREIPGGEVEHLGTTERVVAVTPPKAPCE